MSFVTAYVIYNGTSGNYVGWQNATIQINCDRLRAYSPRPCLLKRRLMPGDGTTIQYFLTFDMLDPEADSNTIQGYFIEVDGQDTMIDIASWTNLVAQCNCPDCDTPGGNIVPRFYTSGISDFVPPTTTTYCIQRSDDGTDGDHEVFSTDYTGRYIGSARLRRNVSGVSFYQIDAFQKPLAVKNDIIVPAPCS